MQRNVNSTKRRIMMWGGTLCMFLLPFVIFMNLRAEDKPKWVWRLDFEMDRDFLDGIFTVSGNPNSHVVREPQVASSRIVRMDLDRRKDKVPFRTELELKDLPAPYFDEGHYAMMEQEYWYGLRVYMPADWQFDTYPEIVMQWNSKPNDGENWRYPPVAVRIENGKAGIGRNYVLYVFGDARKITAPWQDLKGYSFVENYDLGDIKGDLGKWTDWIFHIKWSYEGRGFITIWKDGREYFSKTNISTAYNDPTGPFFKFGIYKWNWNPAEPVIAPLEGVDRRTIYFDNLRVGAGDVVLDDILLRDQPSK